MKFTTPNAITARLQGGDLSGLVIELPSAFRGVDVERKGRIARYRYGGEGDAGPFYVYRAARRSFRRGAVRLDVGNGATGVALNFYP
jgi:hypothetical protein